MSPFSSLFQIHAAFALRQNWANPRTSFRHPVENRCRGAIDGLHAWEVDVERTGHVKKAGAHACSNRPMSIATV
jgi:hypothetical protein